MNYKKYAGFAAVIGFAFIVCVISQIFKTNVIKTKTLTNVANSLASKATATYETAKHEDSDFVALVHANQALATAKSARMIARISGQELKPYRQLITMINALQKETISHLTRDNPNLDPVT